MRLKVFLAPFAFLIAVIISVWYLWPLTTDIMSKLDEVKGNQENLNATLLKKENVENLTASLDSNKDKENYILNFIPSAKDEEKIINGLNYLAGDSGLSLIDVSIIDEKAVSSAKGNSAAAALKSQGKTGITPPETPAVRFAVADVNVSGKYENIKIFLGQLQRMEMFNKINMLSISRANNQDPGGDMLIANLGIKFGYMPYINRTGSNLPQVFSQGNINFSSYSKIRELTASKIPVLDAGQKGKINPFLP